MIHTITASYPTRQRRALNLVAFLGVQNIAANCGQLREVQLANCGNVSDSGVQQLLTGCPHLNLLSAKSSPRLTGMGFGCAALSLESLSLPFCGVTDEGTQQGPQDHANLGFSKQLLFSPFPWG